MAYTGTTYGDITPRQTAYSVVGFLKRAIPLMTIEKFGQQYAMPKNETKTAKFRRYFLTGGTGAYSGEAGDYNMPLALTPLTEGVTPAGTKLDSKDYTVSINQYGNWVGFTDVIQDTHEDYPGVLRELVDTLGEQAAHTVETLRYNVLKAGTNVFYANGTLRTDVNTPISKAMIRKVTRAFKNQNAMKISQVLKSTPAFNTQPIEAAFVALVHPNCENDIRNLDGFINVKQYGQGGAFEGEVGAVEDVRFVSSTVFTSFADAGGAYNGSGVDMLSTTGTNADVYPIIFLAKDAFGVVPLRGTPDGVSNANVMVVNPKPTVEDPLAQRGTAGWKVWTATVILQDAFIIRGEVAATA